MISVKKTLKKQQQQQQQQREERSDWLHVKYYWCYPLVTLMTHIYIIGLIQK